VDLLRVDAHGLSPAEPEHQVAVVNPIAHQGRNVFQHHAADGHGKISPGVYRDDPANAPLVNRLLGQDHARVEPADVPHHEGPRRVRGRRQDLVAVGGGRGHRLLQEHVLAAP